MVDVSRSPFTGWLSPTPPSPLLGEVRRPSARIQRHNVTNLPRSPPSLVKPVASPSRICSPPLQDHGVSASKTTPLPPVPLCSHPVAVPPLPITASPHHLTRGSLSTPHAAREATRFLRRGGGK